MIEERNAFFLNIHKDYTIENKEEGFTVVDCDEVKLDSDWSIYGSFTKAGFTSEQFSLEDFMIYPHLCPNQ